MNRRYSVKRPIQLGLCCLNTQLREKKPSCFSSRRITMKTLEKKGLSHLQEKIIQNIKDTIEMVHWNEKHGIRVFRLSSEMFPHKSNPKVDDYSFDFAKSLLIKLGHIAKFYNHRITMHPGHFNCIGTPNKTVFKNTIADLSYHATMLDIMRMDHNSVMVVHGGGVYGDKKKTLERWIRQYEMLPLNIKKRLVLENCEKNFNIEDCLWISSKIDIPVVFDTHHFQCYQQLHPDETFQSPEYYIPLILKTWTKRNIKPKFHVSEQGSGKCGHHSDFIEKLPNYLLNIPTRYDIEIDIMIEAKKKEQAIFKLYEKYKNLNCLF